MNSLVLDASAILAVAQRERGAAEVLVHRSVAILSAVNHAEVVSALLRTPLPPHEIDTFLAEAFPQVIPFDRRQADVAAAIHAATRSLKLSYADCACLALAQDCGLPVLTGDGKWATIPVAICAVEVRLFR